MNWDNKSYLSKCEHFVKPMLQQSTLPLVYLIRLSHLVSRHYTFVTFYRWNLSKPALIEQVSAASRLYQIKNRQLIWYCLMIIITYNRSPIRLSSALHHHIHMAVTARVIQITYWILDVHLNVFLSICAWIFLLDSSVSKFLDLVYINIIYELFQSDWFYFKNHFIHHSDETIDILFIFIFINYNQFVWKNHSSKKLPLPERIRNFVWGTALILRFARD